MDRRLIMFFVVSFALMVGYTIVLQKLRGPQVADNPPAAQVEKKDADKDKPQADEKNAEKAAAEKQPADKEVQPSSEKKAEDAEKKEPDANAEPPVPEEWLTLGSVDPTSPYRMMATITNRGAALARIELSDEKYRDIDIRSGYLGHIVVDPKVKVVGCPVQLVGAGTPAEKAGLKVGDLIIAADDKEINSPDALKEILARYKPGRTIELKIVRDGKEQTLPATLTRYPLEVIRPAYPLEMIPRPQEGPLALNVDDPHSLLMTMQQIDDEQIAADLDFVNELAEKEKEKHYSDHDKTSLEEEINKKNIEREMPGVAMRGGNWEKVEADREHAVFKMKLPKYGLEILKTYRLKPVPEDSLGNSDYPAYHLVLEIKIVNPSDTARKVAYRLDGPNGLPTEGYWYASKVGRNWGGGAGLRDVVMSFDRGTQTMVSSPTISGMKTYAVWREQSVTYMGVDAQYFSSVLIPQLQQPLDNWFVSSQPLRMGNVDPLHLNWTNVSFRLIGKANKIEPGQSFAQEYKLFAGPKKPPLVAQYDLGELLYYGWFYWVAEPMLWILHAFYSVVGNYGIAIIMLTILVRGCMFPLSFKQAVNTQKMAEIQPEMKRITEKYKKDVEARTKALQELYRKHNTNPFSGCLPILIQLPIFLGLYRSLMVDVELRDAPLISSAVRWCSNLAAPDMLFDWHRMMDSMPMMIQNMLGPFFNILPLLTICLFLWQQHKMMPPPTDDQQAMQQKMMKYMMILMGVMFFKVASGLCIYFIASTLWGLGERQFLPKKTTPAPSPDNGQAKRTKNRDRR